MFDYYLVWYHYFDPGYYAVAKLMVEDIERLPALSIDGFVSCQNVRAAFPTGFSLYAHAKALWGPQQFEDIATEFFERTFKEHGAACKEYMQKLSDAFCPTAFYSESEQQIGNRDLIKKLDRVFLVVAQFLPVIEKNLCHESASVARSWRILFIHAHFCQIFAHRLQAFVKGHTQAAKAYQDRLVKFLKVHEDEIEDLFDPWWFYSAVNRIKPPTR